MGDCLFCKIAKGEIPSKKVYEDEFTYAFWDINPGAPVHILIIPKKHIDSVNELQEEDGALIAHVFEVAKQIAHEQGIAQNGYRIVNNCGVDGGQTVMHLHFHLLGGRNLGWPPG